MGAQENKRRIAEYFEALDARPEAEVIELVDQLFVEDYILHTAGETTRGRDVLKDHIRASYATFGDMQHRIEDNFAEGDMVATRVQFRAVLKGEFLGVAPTGQQIDCLVIYIHRFVDGKIQEAWLDWDSIAVLAARLQES